MTDEDWTTAELGRNVVALTDAIKTLNDTIANLDKKFVLQRVHDVEIAAVRQVQRDHGDAIKQVNETDVPNLHHRINAVKDTTVAKATVWQVVGLLVGLLAVAVTLLAIYHQ